MLVRILDSIESTISKKDAPLLAPLLTVDKTYWTQGRFRKIERLYQKPLWVKKGKDWYTFYTGLIPKVKNYCAEKGIDLTIEGKEIKIPPTNEPKLNGITLREDQKMLVQSCIENGRGVVKGATGIGKTAIQAGLISCFKNYHILLLAHTTAITGQTFKRFQDYGFKEMELFGGGNKVQKPTAKIVISTIQSFAKLDPKDYLDYFDIVIQDESHHSGKMDSQYTTVLSNLLAPMRWGFTATPPDDLEAILITEGLIGPIIGEISINDATEMGILAKPKLILKEAQYTNKLKTASTWPQAYKYGIVENPLRNKQIVDLAVEYVRNKDQVLIFVTQIVHGQILQEMLQAILKRKVEFVRGDMDTESRKTVQEVMKKRNRGRVVIATTTWREGVDIPGLSAVILADGGMSETRIIQGVGRGLRTANGKDSVDIIDFLDLENKHLIKHTGKRLLVYSRESWI